MTGAESAVFGVGLEGAAAVSGMDIGAHQIVWVGPNASEKARMRRAQRRY